MEERQEPKFVDFKAEGEIVTGILTAIERCEIKGKPGIRFVVFNEEENQPYCFLATHQLNQKLRPNDRGKYIEVTYIGTDSNVVRNGNAMRMFRVCVEKPQYLGEANAHGVTITDEDIPF
jgi:hypothetical protein